jgi:hypothetical protein
MAIPELLTIKIPADDVYSLNAQVNAQLPVPLRKSEESTAIRLASVKSNNGNTVEGQRILNQMFKEGKVQVELNRIARTFIVKMPRI